MVFKLIYKINMQMNKRCIIKLLVNTEFVESAYEL